MTDETCYTVKGQRFSAGPLDTGLYIVATPIGNLGDITLRALETLAAADVIACEDKRVSAKLLNHFSIRSQLTSYHEHNADKAGAELLAALGEGQPVALISDAGTPLISDPGYRLVTQARQAGHPVYPIPGASSVMAALSAGGLPTDRFFFEGFLPAKAAARAKRLQELAAVPATLVLFESPNRLNAALAAISETVGADRQIRICRELTKLHEEIAAGSAGELAMEWSTRQVKGEIVILIEPAPPRDDQVDPEEVLADLLKTMSVSRAASEAVTLTGLPKREMYQLALKLESRRKEGRK